MTWAVGVDVGGTKSAAALVSSDGSIGPVLVAPTPALDSPAAVLDGVASLVARVVGDEAVVGVGIGTAGVVGPGTGTIVSSTDSFTRWVGTEVGAGVGVRTGLTTAVCNDVDAHALGEAWLGAGRGASSMLLVAVGTGVGGGLVLGGRLWSGAHGHGGEMGHIPAPGAEGLRCGCGRYGHLEAVAAGPAIARRYSEMVGEAVDTRGVVARADADPRARQVVADAATALGRAIAGVMSVVDPDLVVIGGGVPEIGPLWWDPLLETIRAETVTLLSAVPVVPARLGTSAALLGAARLIFDATETEKR